MAFRALNKRLYQQQEGASSSVVEAPQRKVLRLQASEQTSKVDQDGRIDILNLIALHTNSFQLAQQLGNLLGSPDPIIRAEVLVQITKIFTTNDVVNAKSILDSLSLLLSMDSTFLHVSGTIHTIRSMVFRLSTAVLHVKSSTVKFGTDFLCSFITFLEKCLIVLAKSTSVASDSFDGLRLHVRNGLIMVLFGFSSDTTSKLSTDAAKCPRTSLAFARLLHSLAEMELKRTSSPSVQLRITSIMQSSPDARHREAACLLIKYFLIISDEDKQSLVDLFFTEVAHLLTQDNCTNVRIAALETLHTFADRAGDCDPPKPSKCQDLAPPSDLNDPSLVNTVGGLINECFVVICEAVNDVDWRIVARTASLIGSIRGVSDHLLRQSLHRNLVATGRKANSGGGGHSRPPAGDLVLTDSSDSATRALLNQAACGALAVCLEDERAEVRLAGLASLHALAKRRRVFAAFARDALMDMLADEIPSVVLASLTALSTVGQAIALTQDQVTGLVFVLKEASFEVRRACLRAIANASLPSRAALMKVHESLMDLIRRCPGDHLAIFRCCAELGSSQAELVLAAVPLLCPGIRSGSSCLEKPEARLDDPEHVASLILLVSASRHFPQIRSLMPDRCASHVPYLATRFSEFLKVSSDQFSSSSDSNSLPHFDRLSPIRAQMCRLQAALAENSNDCVYLSKLFEDIKFMCREVGDNSSIDFIRRFCDFVVSSNGSTDGAASIHFLHLFSGLSERVTSFFTTTNRFTTRQSFQDAHNVLAYFIARDSPACSRVYGEIVSPLQRNDPQISFVAGIGVTFTITSTITNRSTIEGRTIMIRVTYPGAKNVHYSMSEADIVNSDNHNSSTYETDIPVRLPYHVTEPLHIEISLVQHNAPDSSYQVLTETPLRVLAVPRNAVNDMTRRYWKC